MMLAIRIPGSMERSENAVRAADAQGSLRYGARNPWFVAGLWWTYGNFSF